MKRRFKSKRAFKHLFIKFILIIIIIIISFLVTIKILTKVFLQNLTQEKYLNYIINDSFGKHKIDNFGGIGYLLKHTFGIKEINSQKVAKEEKSLLKENKPQENVLKKPNNTLPEVYIYNSHQVESYQSPFMDTFNIKNTVIIASYILQECLQNLGISSLVEENNVADILHANGWKYNASYKASRILLEDAKKKHPSLKFFIDLHRDSSKYKTTTIEMDGKKYARYMIVIGLKNSHYESNLVFATAIDEDIKKLYPMLSRGILKKKGKGANGLYNQDFSPYAILIEMGGQYNTIEEVNNTLKIIAPIIATHIKGAK